MGRPSPIKSDHVERKAIEEEIPPYEFDEVDNHQIEKILFLKSICLMFFLLVIIIGICGIIFAASMSFGNMMSVKVVSLVGVFIILGCIFLGAYNLARPGGLAPFVFSSRASSR